MALGLPNTEFSLKQIWGFSLAVPLEAPPWEIGFSSVFWCPLFFHVRGGPSAL